MDDASSHVKFELELFPNFQFSRNCTLFFRGTSSPIPYFRQTVYLNVIYGVKLVREGRCFSHILYNAVMSGLASQSLSCDRSNDSRLEGL